MNYRLWSFIIAAMCAQLSFTHGQLRSEREINEGLTCEEYEKLGTHGHRMSPVKALHISQDDADFMILKFDEFKLADDDYITVTEVITDPLNLDQTPQQYKYFGNKYNGSFETDPIISKDIVVEFHKGNVNEGENTDQQEEESDGQDSCDYNVYHIDSLVYKADMSMHTKDNSSEESVCGEDDSEEAVCYNYYRTHQKRSNAVIRLLVKKGTKYFYCTGWLVGCEGHVITNEHCISEQSHASNTRFEFDAKASSCSQDCRGGLACKGTVEATGADLIIANPELDFALLKPWTRKNLASEYGYLVMRESGPQLNERIYVPQHPSGWGKRLAVKAGSQFAKLVTLTQGGCSSNQAGYYADTRGGSSGAPVISSIDHKVVALHHCGGCPNTGVQINKIIDYLRQRTMLPDCALDYPAPVTAPPTTPAPVTRPPETQPPATSAPITSAPVTPAPVTPAPKPTPSPRARIDGTIYRLKTSKTVDHVSFEMTETGELVIDMLSYEYLGNNYKDLNRDCDGSYLDTVMYIFQDDGNGRPVGPKAMISNDDDDELQDHSDRISVSRRDSYLKQVFRKGKYILAIGTYPLSEFDAFIRLNRDAVNEKSPWRCGKEHKYGNYQVLFKSTSSMVVKHSGSYNGRQCDAPLTC